MIWFGLLLGAIVGIVSGMVGIGGGILVVPALVFFWKMDQHRAQGTSLAFMLLPIGIFACMEYYKAGHVDVKLAGMLAIGFAVGGYFGGMFAQHVDAHILRRVFALLLVAMAAKLFFS